MSYACHPKRDSRNQKLTTLRNYARMCNNTRIPRPTPHRCIIAYAVRCRSRTTTGSCLRPSHSLPQRVCHARPHYMNMSCVCVRSRTCTRDLVLKTPFVPRRCIWQLEAATAANGDHPGALDPPRPAPGSPHTPPRPSDRRERPPYTQGPCTGLQQPMTAPAARTARTQRRPTERRGDVRISSPAVVSCPDAPGRTPTTETCARQHRGEEHEDTEDGR